MSIINIILSGGVGSRLWPLSRKSRPKQYIPLFGGHTLFQMCASRNQDLVDSITIVGSIDNYLLSRADLEACGIGNYSEIVEATPRNTAASIAFAAFAADPDDILFVTPSDHIIDAGQGYRDAVQKAIEKASQGRIVTFGAVPRRPETGYGYIEHDASYKVLSFKEKPTLEKAQEYIDKKTYLWNAGMFCFKASVYLSELQRYAPVIFETALRAFEKRDGVFLAYEESMQIPSVSVDYAVMEHSPIIDVVPFSFDWNDLGSFESIWDYLEKKEGHHANNLVLGSQKHVEFIGLDNIILVETEDAILVTTRDKSQEVKNIYERLETEKPELLK